MLTLDLIPDHSVAIKIVLSECIFNVRNQGMLLEHLAVILDHRSLVELDLLTLLFILVRVLGIFVEALITITIHSNLESLTSFLEAWLWRLLLLVFVLCLDVSTWGGDGIFHHLEGLGNGRIGIEKWTVWEHLKRSLTTFGSCKSFLKINQEIPIEAHDFPRVFLVHVESGGIDDQVEFAKFDCTLGKFSSGEHTDHELGVDASLRVFISGIKAIGESTPNIIGTETLCNCVLNSLTASSDDILSILTLIFPSLNLLKKKVVNNHWWR